MLARERHAAIEERVRANNIILIGEISNLFGVSLETARRDLETLQDQGIVKRIHGGAVLASMPKPGKRSNPVKNSSYSEKKAIGIAAAALVNHGETIFLGNGTTAREMAHNLKNLKDLTVLTNSIMVVNELINSNVKLIILGGVLKNDEQIIYCHTTEQMLENYYMDKAFFSCGGITDKGVTDYGDVLDRMKMAEHSQEMILLVDSGKFGRNAKFKVCDIDVLDKVVVDANINPQHLARLHKQNVEVVLAPIPAQADEEE